MMTTISLPDTSRNALRGVLSAVGPKAYPDMHLYSIVLYNDSGALWAAATDGYRSHAARILDSASFAATGFLDREPEYLLLLPEALTDEGKVAKLSTLLRMNKRAELTLEIERMEHGPCHVELTKSEKGETDTALCKVVDPDYSYRAYKTAVMHAGYVDRQIGPFETFGSCDQKWYEAALKIAGPNAEICSAPVGENGMPVLAIRSFDDKGLKFRALIAGKTNEG